MDVELLYLQHLTATDRQLLRSVAGPQMPVSEAVGLEALEAELFRPAVPDGVSVGISPFLAFASAVHRTAAELERSTFVEERWAPRLRVPVFDVADLRAILSDPRKRFFFVELLSSYTRVTSGVTWTRTARGWRRRRFSELDPARLAEQLEIVRPEERAGVYRRLGDLALFLLGVFPDHPPALGPGASTERLLRISGLSGGPAAGLPPLPMLELLGSRWYSAAVSSARSTHQPTTDALDVVGFMAEHFRQARRVLNAVTDRYLFPWRERWFAA